MAVVEAGSASARANAEVVAIPWAGEPAPATAILRGTGRSIESFPNISRFPSSISILIPEIINAEIEIPC